MNKVMKKNAFLILALIVVNISFCISTVIGQTNQDASISEHFLKFSLPIVHNQVKDNLVAPLRWDGIGSGLVFSWLTTGPKIIHEVCLIVNVSGLENRYKYKGYTLEASLGYSLGCKLNQGVLGGTLYLGPQIKWDSKINFFRDWDDSHIYWSNSYEAGPSLKWIKYYKEKQNVSITVKIPFLAIVSRPPEYQYTDQPPLIKPSYYFKAMNENLRIVTVNNFYSLRFQADYSYEIKGRNMIGGTWVLDYKACKLPMGEGTTNISNILMINYYKMFGKK
jgi:hypothetical protein